MGVHERQRERRADEEQAGEREGAVVRPGPPRRRRGLQVRRLAARELRRLLPVAVACLVLGALVRVGFLLGPGAWAGYAADASLATVSLIGAWLLGVACLAPDAESGAQRLLVGLPLGGVKQLLARLLPAAGLAALLPALFALLQRLLVGDVLRWWPQTGLGGLGPGMDGQLLLQAPGLFLAGLLAGALARHTLAAFALAPVLWVTAAWGASGVMELVSAALPRLLPSTTPAWLADELQGALSVGAARVAVPLALLWTALAAALRGDLHQRSPQPGLRAAARALAALVALVLGVGALGLTGLHAWDRLGSRVRYQSTDWGAEVGLSAVELRGLGGERERQWLRTDSGDGPCEWEVSHGAASWTLTRPGKPALEFERPREGGEGDSGAVGVIDPQGSAPRLVLERGVLDRSGAWEPWPAGLRTWSWEGGRGLLYRAPDDSRSDEEWWGECAWFTVAMEAGRLGEPQPLRLPEELRPGELRWIHPVRGEFLIARGVGVQDLFVAEWPGPRAGSSWRRVTIPEPTSAALRAMDAQAPELGWSMQISCASASDRALLQLRGGRSRWSICALLDLGGGAAGPSLSEPIPGPLSRLPSALGDAWIGEAGLLRVAAGGEPELLPWSAFQGGEALQGGGQPRPLGCEADGQLLVGLPAAERVDLLLLRGLYRVDLAARVVSPALELERALIEQPLVQRHPVVQGQ